MSLFLIAYKSPQSDEKEKCNKYFVLYRIILFTGKTLAPSSSSCSLPVLYILMLALLKKKKKKKSLLELPAALYLALSLAVGHRRCIFQSEPVRTHSHSRIENRRQLQIFSMPNILRASANVSGIPSDRVFDNSHCAIVTRGNELQFTSDLRHLSAIYQNLSASEKSG